MVFAKSVFSKQISKFLNNYYNIYIIIEPHTAAVAAVAAVASRPARSAAPWPGRPGAPPTGMGGAPLLLPLLPPLYVVLSLYIYICVYET